MKKRVLLIGYNFHPEPTGIGKYSGEMLMWLAKQGHDCAVITTYPYYPYWRVQEPYRKSRFGYLTENQSFDSGGNLRIHRCPMYVPARPTGVTRILLDVSFFVSAFFKLLFLLPQKKYDYVVAVAPSFQFGLLGVLYKKMRKAKFLYHIQDLQIEAARDLQMIKSDKAINALFKLERYIFREADVVSSISEGMMSRISTKSKKEVKLFPNWTDVDMFFPVMEKNELKINFGFNTSDIIVLYSGAIGEKQGLESILYAAKKFEDNRSVKFVICGSGPYKENLIGLKESLCLTNVVFFPLQPFEKFNDFLNAADVHLVIQKENASDLVMPSKLATILAVGGLAVVTANSGSSLHSLISKYNMALLVNAENQYALNRGIEKAIKDNVMQIKKNARAYAEQHLAIEKVMSSFDQLLVQ